MQFIEEKIRVITKKLKDLQEQSLYVPDFEYIYVSEYKKGNTPPSDEALWEKYVPGTMLGGVDQHYWFRFQIDAIQPKSGKELRLYVKTGQEGRWDATNPQGLVYLNGVTTQGLDTNHYWIPLEYGKKYDVAIYYYTGMIENCNCSIRMELTECDLMVEQLYYDLCVPCDVMEALPQDDNNRIVIKNALNRAVMMLDLRKPYSEDFYISVECAIKYINEEFYEKLCGKGNLVTNCIGHTHIDVAWFWTVMQTKEKAQRSFSTVINLMKKYDDYKFMSGQPQLYQFVKENDPLLYDEIKKRVSEGRWDVEGAMWLEPDVNMSSGESLIRQIYRGKKFMQDEFGVESRIAWLPDTFGFSASLPQILVKSGIDRFFTTKLIWNETDKMPHDLFMWKGIDGTEIFTSLDFGNDFKISPALVMKACNEFKDKELTDNRFMIFGWGDGGGGPTAEQLEYQKRMGYGIPGMPKLEVTDTNSYFDKVEEDFKKNTHELRELPKWAGEIYLELHRGTYTFMSESKRYNRKCEMGLMEAEGLATLDMIINSGDYPKAELDDALSVILLNQFHDILPGSAIKEVYDVSYAEYDEALNKLESISQSSLKKLADKICTEGGLLAYNPTSFTASGVVDVEGRLHYVNDVPAHGWRVVQDNSDLGVIVSEKSIENDLIRVEFDEHYEIISVYDKEYDREIVENGKTVNMLCIYEDYPKEWDAWDIFEYYKQKMWKVDDVQSVELLQNGLKIKRWYGNSDFEQIVSLCKGTKRIDFATTVDWHEDHVLLRAEFPLDINASSASYDIQFGYTERPTHKNTSWDESKFEVCAHKWADLSEGNYGVSLMSDCKYGYSADENVLGISLLKAATWPNYDPDTGVHKFTYSLYPHTGDFRAGGTIKEAYLLNMPFRGMKINKNSGELPECFSMILTDKKNAVIETVKKSETDNSIIVRMYEAHNCKDVVTVTTGFDFKEVYLCDMMENRVKLLDFEDRKTKIKLSNFEVVTLEFVV